MHDAFPSRDHVHTPAPVAGKMDTMSYDIALYPRLPDQPWDEAIAAAEADDEALASDEQALASGVDTWRRIEGRVREVVTGPVEVWVAEEAGGDVYGELDAEETGIQVELFDRSASVSFPYRSDADVERVHHETREAVRIVAEETGYEAYDAQTGAPFDGTFDDEAGRAAARDRSDAPAAADTDADTDSDTAPDQPTSTTEGLLGSGSARQSPASLRRRGWVYTVLGVVIVIFGIQRYSSGNGNALTIILLVIGFMDLVGGAFLLALASRAAQSERAGLRPGPTEER